MSLREEIIPYTDGNGLVAPYLCDPHTRGSDNGPMFSSEYYILLKERGEWVDSDLFAYVSLMNKCMIRPGCISRAPGDTGQDAPDDYHGVLGACGYFANLLPPMGKTVISSIGKQVVSYGFWHFWNFNNASPWKFTGESFLGRMPQIVVLAYCAAGRKPLFLFFHFLITALIIATSCMKTPTGDTDSRRLAWLLIMGTKNSLMCRWAAKIWWNRLRKDYGEEGMRSVARVYYQNSHPFQRYHLNAWETS